MSSIPSIDPHAIATDSMSIRWDAGARVASVRYTSGASLVAKDGVDLVDALTRWIGESSEPFAVLADGAGLRGTNSEYRAKAGSFFRQHRDTAFVALINLGPAIQIVVELFRVGTGIQLKTFPSEVAARAWLQSKGIAA